MAPQGLRHRPVHTVACLTAAQPLFRIAFNLYC